MFCLAALEASSRMCERMQLENGNQILAEEKHMPLYAVWLVLFPQGFLFHRGPVPPGCCLN